MMTPGEQTTLSNGYENRIREVVSLEEKHRQYVDLIKQNNLFTLISDDISTDSAYHLSQIDALEELRKALIKCDEIVKRYQQKTGVTNEQRTDILNS